MDPKKIDRICNTGTYKSAVEICMGMGALSNGQQALSALLGASMHLMDIVNNVGTPLAYDDYSIYMDKVYEAIRPLDYSKQMMVLSKCINIAAMALLDHIVDEEHVE